MYTPKHFELTNTSEAVAFMQRYSFATLINVIDDLPVATHLPFVITQNGNQVILSSHLAKPNVQAQHLLAGTSLVMFTEPHAYIAPKHYEGELNVPTWNYIAIHAYGRAALITDELEKLTSLEHMIRLYDSDYLKQWATLPTEYKSKMSKGIVVFDIIVTDLQGKKKLSQNRTDVDKQSVVQALSASSNANDQTIADYMRSEH
jgi:transcriptional regulator